VEFFTDVLNVCNLNLAFDEYCFIRILVDGNVKY